MLVGGAAVKPQAPTILQIETRCYTVTNTSEFAIQGKRVTFKPIAGGSVANWEVFDEEKVLKQPHVKLITAPTIRTLDGQAASLSYTFKDAPAPMYRLGYLPKVQSGKVGLDIKFLEMGEGNKELWSYPTSAVMGKESQAWVITRNNAINLYIVKAYVVESGG